MLINFLIMIFIIFLGVTIIIPINYNLRVSKKNLVRVILEITFINKILNVKLLRSDEKYLVQIKIFKYKINFRYMININEKKYYRKIKRIDIKEYILKDIRNIRGALIYLNELLNKIQSNDFYLQIEIYYVESYTLGLFYGLLSILKFNLNNAQIFTFYKENINKSVFLKINLTGSKNLISLVINISIFLFKFNILNLIFKKSILKTSSRFF